MNQSSRACSCRNALPARPDSPSMSSNHSMPTPSYTSAVEVLACASADRTGSSASAWYCTERLTCGIAWMAAWARNSQRPGIPRKLSAAAASGSEPWLSPGLPAGVAQGAGHVRFRFPGAPARLVDILGRRQDERDDREITESVFVRANGVSVAGSREGGLRVIDAVEPGLDHGIPATVGGEGLVLEEIVAGVLTDVAHEVRGGDDARPVVVSPVCVELVSRHRR